MKTIQQFEKETGIKFNKNMSGKMEGITCLSTSNLCNRFCAARKNNPDMICSKCFADSTCSRYSALRENMDRNTKILTTRLFEVSDFPIINALVFRLESFGDLNNDIQCINYFRLCKRNPLVRFALWTKNPGIVAKALKTESKPENLVILLSSPYIDRREDMDRWSFADKTFTVYRKETIQREGIEINCGARSCMTCMRCYNKNTETDIREQLK